MATLALKIIDISKKLTPLRQPDVRPLSQLPVLYELQQNVCYLLGDLPPVTIPKKFQFDGMSIPRVLWSIAGLANDGPQRAAAMLHDWIYEAKDHCGFTREQADGFLLQFLLQGGVDPEHAKQCYEAVRAFGWMFWGNAAKATRHMIDPQTVTMTGLRAFAKTHPALSRA